MKVFAAIRRFGTGSRTATSGSLARSRTVRVGLVAAMVGAVAISGGAIPAADAANAPFGVTIGYDGTGAPASPDCPFIPTNPHDGQVCTNDGVGYVWAYTLPTSASPRSVTFAQTLPAGVSWDPSNTTVCTGGASFGYTGTSSISPDGTVLTCTITVAAGPASSGNIPVLADVSANVANGTTLNSSLAVVDPTGAKSTYAAPPVTVVAKPEVDLRKQLLSSGGKYYIQVTAVQTEPTTKGVAALASPIVFTDDLSGMPVGMTVPSSCYVPPAPPITTSNPGTWTCSISGNTMTVTITSADTTGTGGRVGGNPVVFAGSIPVNLPTPTGPTTISDQLESFDPKDLANQSNYDADFEPGGKPGDTCTNPANNNNCASLIYGSTGTGSAGFSKSITAVHAPNVPAPTNSAGTPIVTPAGRFDANITTNGSPVAKIICDVWDPAKQQLDPTTAPSAYYFGSTTPVVYTVEYGTAAYADDAARANAACDAGPWYPALAAVPNGATVTSVRFLLAPTTVTSPLILGMRFTNLDSTPGDRVVDYAAGEQNSQVNARSSASYIVTDSVLYLTKTAPSVGANNTVGAGATVSYTLDAGFFASAPAAPQVTVIDQLPSCEVNPVLDPNSAANWTMTVGPAGVGPDGVPCTSDDTGGATLTFVSTQPGVLPPIKYTVDASILTPNLTSAKNTAIVSTPGNQQARAARQATKTITIVAASQISMQKTVDHQQIEPGRALTYTLAYNNPTGTDAGKTQWIDVLPYNGDTRGSHFSGSVALTGTTVPASLTGVSFDYTNATPSAVDTDPATNTDTWCAQAQFNTPGCPTSFAQVTAVRLSVNPLGAGQSGAVKIALSTSRNANGDVYANEVGQGRAANLAGALGSSNTVSTTVVATSISGVVYGDANRNGVRDAAETGRANVTVNWTGPNNTSGSVTTDANGAYTIPNLAGGNYTVTPDQNSVGTYLAPTAPANGSSAVSVSIASPATDVNFGYALTGSISTTISTGPTAEVGDTVRDNVTVTSTSPSLVYYARLYGPSAPVNGSCAGVDWATSFRQPPSTYPADPGTPFQTGPETLSAAGCYSYLGRFGNAQVGYIDLAPGDKAETVLVSPRQPTLTTVAKPSGTAPNSTVTDEVVLGNTSGFPGVINWALLGPVAPIGGSCANVSWNGASTVASGGVPTTGDGTYVVPATGSTTVTAAGCYTYTETFVAADPTKVANANSAAGQPNETFQIGRNLPQVTTQVSSQQVVSGSSVNDEVTLANMGNASGDFTWTLLGPVAPNANGDCAVDFTNAASAASGSVAFTGDGTYTTTPDQTLTAVGCYTYVETVPQTATTSAVTTQPGVTLETVRVIKRPVIVNTSVSAATMTGPGYLSDHITVSGAPDRAQVTIQPVGPVAPVSGDCATVDWSSAPLIGSPQTKTLNPSSDSASSDPAYLTAAGCYSFIVTALETDTTFSATSPAGAPNEVAQVLPLEPTVSTTISATSAVSGGIVNDSVTIGNTAGATRRGGVSWQLLGPVAPNNGACTGLDWSASAQNPFASGTFDLVGDRKYDPTPDVTVGAPGCYTYVERVLATDRTSEVATRPGDPAETVLVGARQTSLTTTAQVSSTEPGAVVNDLVQPGNTGGANSTVHWSLLRIDALDGSCDAVDWADAEEVASGDTPTVGDTPVRTADVTVRSAGCYTYADTLAATATTTEAVSERGLDSETFQINAIDPQITTAISQQTATTGDSVSDAVTITNTAGAQGEVKWALLGPLTPNASGDCTGLDWSSSGPVASGSFQLDPAASQYTTGKAKPNSAGCYTYVESIGATDRTNEVKTDAGVAAETVLVSDPPPASPAHDPGRPAQPVSPGQPVSPAQPGSTPSLAFTGTPVGQGILAGAALLLFGIVLTVAARRRRYRSE